MKKIKDLDDEGSEKSKSSKESVSSLMRIYLEDPVQEEIIQGLTKYLDGIKKEKQKK